MAAPLNATLRATTVALCVGLCALLAKPPPTYADQVTLEGLPNAQVMKVLFGSQVELVADLFWIRMTNVASRAANAREGAALIPLGNLIADLAPRFKYPYFVGGVIAPFRRGRTKDYDNAREALALMTRGVANVHWGRLWLQKAYTELELLQDPIAAADTLTAFSKEADAPSYVLPLATRLYAQGGSFDQAREFARAMANSDDPAVRADGEARLKQIDLEQLLVYVDEQVARYTTQFGHPPHDLAELMRGLLLPLPADPMGGEIELTPGGARSTLVPTRFRQFLPIEE